MHSPLNHKPSDPDQNFTDNEMLFIFEMTKWKTNDVISFRLKYFELVEEKFISHGNEQQVEFRAEELSTMNTYGVN